MATNKKAFTLRFSGEAFDKIGVLAARGHRSVTNYTEFVLLKHLKKTEDEQGVIKADGSSKEV